MNLRKLKKKICRSERMALHVCKCNGSSIVTCISEQYCFVYQEIYNPETLSTTNKLYAVYSSDTKKCPFCGKKIR